MDEFERVKIAHDNALLFLRAGGRISLGEWERLSAEERVALALAGDRFFERQAALAARFNGNPAAISEVLSGGSERREQALRQAVSDVVHELTNRLEEVG